jgi:mycothiol synthase
MKIEVIGKVTPEVLDHLRSFFDEVREHDHHAALGEHKWLDLVHGGRPGFSGVLATDPDHDHSPDKPLGYAQLSRHHDPDRPHWGLEIVVHPEHRGVGVELALVRKALEVVKDAGGGHVHLWVFQPSEIHDSVAHQLGLTRGRDLLHMRVHLPVDHDVKLPDDVQIRAFEPGRDEEPWLDLNNRAFRHHPEQGAWDRETLDRRMKEPWFDPEDLLLAVDDGGLVGSNWTKLDHDHGVGEIYVIAVDPSRHGSGLGKALSVAGLRHMADRGMREGSLYVDSANEPALKMYRGIGFDVHHLDRAYVTDV